MENSNKDFSHLISFLSRIQTSIKDTFFAHRFLSKIEHLTTAYIDYKISQIGEDRSVAQYNSSKDMKYALEALIDLVEYITKLNLASTTSLLQAQKFLLQAQIELSRQINDLNGEIDESLKKESKTPTAVKKVAPKEKPVLTSLSDSQANILDFIKNNPDVRTKEIITKFNSLSGRTVKRNLAELIKEGLIIKRGENKAVYYRQS